MKSLPYSFFCLCKLLAVILFLGCTNPSKENSTTTAATERSDETIEPGIIHIQFVDKPEFNSILHTKTKRNRERLDYIALYDDFEREDFRFNEIAKNKSVTYPTKSNRVMIRRYLGFFEFQDFLVHKGDSLVISFDHSKPVVIKRSSGTYAPQDLNVETLINKKYPDAYLTAGMADDTRNVAFKHFFDDPEENKRQSARKGYEKGAYLEELENKMGVNLLSSVENLKHNSQQILDSLRSHKQISDEVYKFYQQKYSNLLLKLEIMADSLDSTQAAKELNSRYARQSYQDIYFNQCLDNFEKKYITSKAKWTVSNQYNLKDPKESFTLAKGISGLSPSVKEQLLFASLGKVDLFFPDETQTYLKAFVNTVKDTTLIKKALAKYQKDKLLNKTPSNLHLLTLNREQITIEELLKSKKGKVIYLDFWASWCAPCIEEMPHSKDLFQVYENKNLEVVFVSLDDSFMKWEKASERLGVNLTMNSFRILGPEKSKFLQEHKLTTIPRYMVVDKSGKIINANAPCPSDPKVRQVLDRALEE
ncbi:TlpA disulfide reductase family protein [Telluribacter sp.]|jgi:thiol-disulfide isomerase/thioredoxin|uniref:TlpA family protein disulfide reductase n=1 Tax=Telluribacter sp. TaxID=1978767 RepID=UPI002E123A5F|nr:TlpA disulfide reductase family protein [Telluribacter sp.]